MATKRGSKSKKTKAETAIVEDAEIVETSDVDAAAAPDTDLSTDPSPVEEVSAEAPDAPSDDAPTDTDETPAEPEITEDVAATESEPVAALPAPEPQKRSGVPTIVGGAVAAVIGFGVAQFVPNGWPVTVDSSVTEALASADADLADRLSAVEARSTDELQAALEGQIAGVEGAVDAATADVAAQLAALSDRITELESRPVVDLSSLDNSAAFEAELEKLRADIQAVGAEANAQIEAARNEANLLEQNAAKAAAAAAQRAALSRVLAALDSGVPYAATLAEFGELTDVEVPEALTAGAAEGVPTLAKLQDDFPPLARDALAAMRKADSGDATLGNFFRNQFGARSLEPQEGNSPDAILSRIEAAATEGRLADAVAETQTLPEVGQTILAPWVQGVEIRQAAFAAADALTQSLTSQ